MSRHASLWAAAAVVLLANLLTLGHAWRNRAGAIESDITLTQRELYTLGADKNDSGITLILSWLDTSWAQPAGLAPWLDGKMLADLGFDTSLDPSSPKASEFYQRQRPRRVYVALEYNGPAWQAEVEALERQARQRGAAPAPQVQGTRLVAVDADRDPVRLRARHPDRGAVMIVRAVVAIETQSNFAFATAVPPARLYGSVQDIPSSINVPRPFSDALRRLASGRVGGPPYQVHLRYGADYEPWIVGITFNAPQNP